MNEALENKVSYLHDARIFCINLNIEDSGIRSLAMLAQCHPDCGLKEWDGKKLRFEFWDTIVIFSEIFGIDAGAEEINTFDFIATDKLSSCVNELVLEGSAAPSHFVSVVFQSGSQIDIACQEVRVSDW